MRKNVFAAALILALGVGSFAACSSDDVVPPQPGTETLGGTTFMAVKFAIPQGTAQRSNDYNHIGPWSGRDQIEGYKAYIFSGAAGSETLEAVQYLTSTDFAQAAVGNNYVITPNKAVRVQPGPKVVYVVVNPNATTEALLPSTLSATTLAAFKTAYESKDLATAGAGVFTSAVTPANFETSTKNVAHTVTVGGNVKDVIVMTGEPAGATTPFVVADGVTEAQATGTSPLNQASVEVKRTVARVVVTSTATSYTLQGDDPYTPLATETTYNIGTVSNLRFVTAQSERELYFKQTAAAANTSTNNNYGSPAYAQNVTVPTAPALAPYGIANDPEAANILKQYDYTNLWKNRTAGVLGGNEVHQETGTWTAQQVGELAHDCDFILPTTHEYVTPATGANYKYRKGNTAYVLVRAAFVPNQIVEGEDYSSDPAVSAARTSNNLPNYVTAVNAKTGATLNADGTVQTPVAPKAWAAMAGHEPAELVYGVSTKKFYTSEYASQDPVFQGEIGQPVQKFTKVTEGGQVGYKMLYFAWVNPDVTTEWYNSPVYRNNIYHVEINGIGGLGENWNPLVPATPTNTNDDPHHPYNPDPFVPNSPTPLNIPKPTPGGNIVPPVTPITPPVTPVTPIKPEDPLTQKKTYMSVKVTVLPWQVHSYKFTLKN